MYFLNFLNSIFISLELMVMVLISVAFFTLLERKVLGYIQIRKGPNKVGFLGLFQPFADAVKLFSKEMFLVIKSNYIFYLFSPILSMLIMLMLWQNLPLTSMILSMKYSFLMIFCVMSLGVYGVMIGGWSSNSLYSLIGGIRSIAQTISYEVSMILLILSLIFMTNSFNVLKFFDYQIFSWFIFSMYFSSLILFISFLAELNRTPFDFAEGESELVSGFNTEYMSGSFALIFIAEYGMIIFLMYLFSVMFLGCNIFNLIFYYLLMIMMFVVIWVRGTFPRFRYDNLMYLTWKSFLPISINLVMMVVSIQFIYL
uniref:NADH-ubiquinone oxidoreductase chain 1 n=1 Tax=Sycophila sp. 2 JXW-2020 TaxID=2781670 RepID=A0A8A3UTW8_9HYME|nr:NADH dehydrogenase subunit 1 [Sycophila sp. 2 JXW-2020]